jgi:ABC-type multidrug transport system fused ATPase/permease subunit
MFLLAEYTFGQGLLTVLSIFIFVAWIMVLITILSDLFRDHDTSGWVKAIWVLFLIFIPFLTALIYLIARGGGMRERAIKQQQEAQSQLDAYVKQTAGGTSAADEVAKLKKLHDDGAITDAEYEEQKRKALA